MDIIELAVSCLKALDHKGAVDLPGTPHIILQMPPQKAERPTRRLLPRGKCPVGRVISRCGDYDVVSFEAADVLAWCVANSNGAITLEAPNS